MSAGPVGSTNAASRRRRRRLGVLLAVVAPVLLGGCTLPRFWGYRGATTQGHDEFLLYAWTFIAAIVVGVIVAGLILWSVLRYRRRHSDEMPRQFQYHVPLEITYTVIPVIIVLVLFAFTFVTENNVDNALPASQTYAKVTVTAFQWGWKFDYTDQGRYVLGVQRADPDPVGSDGNLDSCTTTAATPEDCLGPGLVLPAGENTEITLVSNDVIHGFYVPQFNFSRYAQPGVRNWFYLSVKSPGVYRGQCTQLCGLYHSQMFFHVVALAPAEFQAWLRSDQLTPDTAPKPNPAGSQANNGLPPAYPAGSSAGSVQPPVTSPTSASSTTTTAASGTSTTAAPGVGGTTASTEPSGTNPTVTGGQGNS